MMASITEFCNAMRWAADSDQVGYSQSDRWGVVFYGDGYYNADCSSLVIQAAQYAGFDTGWASYTGDMSDAFCTHGWNRLPVGIELQPGDILLNDGSHVAVWLGDCIAQASIDENGNIAGGSRGDQTGSEVNTCGYYDYPWNAILRWPYESEDDDVSAIDVWSYKNESVNGSNDAYQLLTDIHNQVTRTDSAGHDNPVPHDFFGRLNIVERNVDVMNDKLDRILAKL